MQIGAKGRLVCRIKKIFVTPIIEPEIPRGELK
jgi:hypothetical protein